MSRTCSSSLKIGIVGFGSFGQFLAKTMIKQGHTLRAISHTDYTHSSLQMGIQFFRNVVGFLEADNDVILICTSILSLSEVLTSMPLTRLKRPALFVDVLSVKEHPREILLRDLNFFHPIPGTKERGSHIISGFPLNSLSFFFFSAEESDILCTHPMFGPDSGKDGWNDLTFVYDKVRIRDEAICSNFLHIFASEGCRMLQMSCEEHDKVAAKSQFITHTIGRTLAEMDIKSTPIDTKGFQTLVQLPVMVVTCCIDKTISDSLTFRNLLQKDTTMRDSLDLYSGLFIHNRFAVQELDNLEQALHKVKEMLLALKR
ncbi:hypothetical protein VNO77_30176 [Canavalia gladiata]|uniref:Prephenate/arogenate dehydrogenase domain-containing protein n=1 Tax=Canavalia gladiata TaxID=3824 RepID=A0AAN9Q457_CANGL